MKWFYEWRYKRHQNLSERYFGVKYQTLYAWHIEKSRYYATKLGWLK
jgi:hypothetical protein